MDWEKTNFILGWLRKHCEPLKDETLERLTMIFNVDEPTVPEELKERIEKIDIFNKRRAFRIIRETCSQELNLFIKKPQDLEEKIKNAVYSFEKERLNEILQEYNRLIENPSIMKWDIVPYFNFIAENLRLIQPIRCKERYGNYKFQKSPKGERLVFDLKHSLRAYDILEFHYDKENLFNTHSR